MALALLLNIIFALLAAVLMLFVVKKDFENTPPYLRLFEFGYCGMLFFATLQHTLEYAEWNAGVYTAPRGYLFDYCADIILSGIAIPYAIHHFKKTKNETNQRISI